VLPAVEIASENGREPDFELIIPPTPQEINVVRTYPPAVLTDTSERPVFGLAIFSCRLSRKDMNGSRRWQRERKPIGLKI
jgi:hypothetical protein